MKAVCKVTWGQFGRGYAVYRDGVRVTGIHLSSGNAWAAYRRDCK